MATATIKKRNNGDKRLMLNAASTKAVKEKKSFNAMHEAIKELEGPFLRDFLEDINGVLREERAELTAAMDGESQNSEHADLIATISDRKTQELAIRKWVLRVFASIAKKLSKEYKEKVEHIEMDLVKAVRRSGLVDPGSNWYVNGVTLKIMKNNETSHNSEDHSEEQKVLNHRFLKRLHGHVASMTTMSNKELQMISNGTFPSIMTREIEAEEGTAELIMSLAGYFMDEKKAKLLKELLSNVQFAAELTREKDVPKHIKTLARIMIILHNEQAGVSDE